MTLPEKPVYSVLEIIGITLVIIAAPTIIAALMLWTGI